MKRLADLAVIACAFGHGLARAMLVGVVLTVCGCPAAREAVMRVTPGVPAASSCAPTGSSTCHGAVPVVCSATGRWWPATPTGEPCAYGCATDDAGARCLGADGGAR